MALTYPAVRACRTVRYYRSYGAGNQYAVVDAPQYDSGKCPGVQQIETAQLQLDAFAGGGMKTAAYCSLYFQAGAGSRGQQAQNCLNTIQSSRLGTSSFVGLGVGGSSALPAADAAALISQAAATVSGASVRPAIYTERSSWREITHNSGAFSSYALWATDVGVPSLTPFTTPFGGWTIQSGRQYAMNERLADIKRVDFDVYDPALWP